MTQDFRQWFEQRRAGVLLHPTSLPSRFVGGDLGAEAHHFLEFLAECGFRVWQMLPIGPTHADRSPYQLLSVHAGNPDLIDPYWLMQHQLLEADELDQVTSHEPGRTACLKLAADRFARLCEARAEHELVVEFTAFCRRHEHWLDDFALFMALREAHGEQSWQQWPRPLRLRQPLELAQAAQRHSRQMARVRFEQFVFHEQWQQLRQHAGERGIALFGDMPIFVHLDSADVWADQELFRLDGEGQPEVVTGVPPDYFSADGQRWGNPHYHWQRMQADGFNWWVQRVATQQSLFDLIRIDHFRGFEASWEIPADVATAIEGRWVKAPGDELFKTIADVCGAVPMVAENLGLITAEVEALRRRLALPGMMILQFAFDGSPDNPYLPHNHRPLEVVYTGTHDNDTTLGWYHSLDDHTRQRVYEYLGDSRESMPWLFIRTAYASVAGLAIVPMQDLLGLDSEHRMNVPGTAEGNWCWRFDWGAVAPELPAKLRHLAALYGRLPPDSDTA